MTAINVDEHGFELQGFEEQGSLGGSMTSSLRTTERMTELTPRMASLQRLDDMAATGLLLEEMAAARWLTPVEVLGYLGRAEKDFGTGGSVRNATATNPRSLRVETAKPLRPPMSGMLLLYDPKATPDYSEDGISWTNDKGMFRYVNIEGANTDNTGNVTNNNLSDDDGSTGSSTSARAIGAKATFLTCPDRLTFHRREYQSPGGNGLVLLHYLDTIRALRTTSMLVDQIVSMSYAHMGALPPTQPPFVLPQKPRTPYARPTNTLTPTSGSGSGSNTPANQTNGNPHLTKNTPPTKKATKLDDTMGILWGMINEDEMKGTSTSEAMNASVLGSTNDAALSAVIKHISASEEKRIVEAMDDYLLDDDRSIADSCADPNEVTEFDIDEAINQVLTGKGDEGDNDNDRQQVQGGIVEMDLEDMDRLEKLNSMNGGGSDNGSNASEGEASKGLSTRNPAELVEDAIIDALEGAMTEELKLKLTRTTEALLDSEGITLTDPFKKKRGQYDATIAEEEEEEEAEFAATLEDAIANSNKPGTILPRIIDFTPDQHVIGYQTLPKQIKGKKVPLVNNMSDTDFRSSEDRIPYVVISTSTPLPELPTYVDTFSKWVYLAVFIDYLTMAKEAVGDDVGAAYNDNLIKTMSFQRVEIVTPYSYKCKVPNDIPLESVRQIIMAGVLMPKDDSVLKNNLGIELALKLCIQSECAAAADLVTLVKKRTKVELKTSGILRPVLVAPCGGNYVQLISQISKEQFSFFPLEYLGKGFKLSSSSLLAGPSGHKLGALLDSTLGRKKQSSPGSSHGDSSSENNPAPKPTALLAAAGALLNYPDRPEGIALGSRMKEDLQSAVTDNRKRGREGLEGVSSMYVQDANERADGWARSTNIDGLSNAENADRHIKVRFVERMANAISGTADGTSSAANTSDGAQNEFQFDAEQMENLKDAEIDSLLDSMLMRFVEVIVEGSTNEDDLKNEMNYCGYSGLGLLHYAALYNSSSLMTFMLSRGADPNITSIECGLTPLHLAAAAGHDQAVDLLLRNGSDPCRSDSYGLTPAEHAMRVGCLQVAKYIDGKAQATGGMVRESTCSDVDSLPASIAMDFVLQSAFKELSLKDKLGLNLFMDRSSNVGAAARAGVAGSCEGVTIDIGKHRSKMSTETVDETAAFAFITEEDREKMKVAMSLASGMDLEEMNRRAASQDVRKYLKRSNFEAIRAASKQLEKSTKKESKALTHAKDDEASSKTKLSQALAMLVLRKHLPEAP